MSSELLVDLSKIDLFHTEVSEEEIYKMVEKGYLDPKLIPGQPFDE